MDYLDKLLIPNLRRSLGDKRQDDGKNEDADLAQMQIGDPLAMMAKFDEFFNEKDSEEVRYSQNNDDDSESSDDGFRSCEMNSRDQLQYMQDLHIQELKDQIEYRTKFHNMIVHDLRVPAVAIHGSA